MLTKQAQTRLILFFIFLGFLIVLACNKTEAFSSASCENGRCTQCAENVKCCGFSCNNGICGCDASASTQEECNSKHNGNFWCGDEKKPVPDPTPRPGPKPDPTPRPGPKPGTTCCTKGTGPGCDDRDKGCRGGGHQGYFSITFDLTGFEPMPGHVYIRIQRKSSSGTDFLTFPAGSNRAVLTSTSMSAGTSIVPSEYSRVVEPGDTLFFPTTNFISGRLYVSLFHPVNWLIPSIDGAGDTEPLFSTMEFTIDAGVLGLRLGMLGLCLVGVLGCGGVARAG